MSGLLAGVSAGPEPVWGILFAVLLLGELPTPRALLGGAIIIGAARLPMPRPPSPA